MLFALNRENLIPQIFSVLQHIKTIHRLMSDIIVKSSMQVALFLLSRGWGAGVARRRPGSTGFNTILSELNVNGYPFKRSNFLLNKGQLFKGKNLLLESKFFPFL